MDETKVCFELNHMKVRPVKGMVSRGTKETKDQSLSHEQFLVTGTDRWGTEFIQTLGQRSRDSTLLPFSGLLPRTSPSLCVKS